MILTRHIYEENLVGRGRGRGRSSGDGGVNLVGRGRGIGRGRGRKSVDFEVGGGRGSGGVSNMANTKAIGIASTQASQNQAPQFQIQSQQSLVKDDSRWFRGEVGREKFIYGKVGEFDDSFAMEAGWSGRKITLGEVRAMKKSLQQQTEQQQSKQQQSVQRQSHIQQSQQQQSQQVSLDDDLVPRWMLEGNEIPQAMIEAKRTAVAALRYYESQQGSTTGEGSGSQEGRKGPIPGRTYLW